MRLFGDFLDTKDKNDSKENGADQSVSVEEERPNVRPEKRAPTNGSAVADPYAAAVRHYLRGQLDEALEHLERARENGKDLTEVYTVMAQIYLERADFAKAAEFYGELLELEPENAAAQFNAGFALQACEKFEEAKAAFRAAAELDAELGEAHLGVAGCCLKLEDHEGAKAAYEAYLENHPDSESAIFGLGVAYQLSEEWEKAVQHYLAALDKNEKSEGVLTNLGSVYLKQQEHQKAADTFRALLKVQPESATAHEGFAYSSPHFQFDV